MQKKKENLLFTPKLFIHSFFFYSSNTELLGTCSLPGTVPKSGNRWWQDQQVFLHGANSLLWLLDFISGCLLSRIQGILIYKDPPDMVLPSKISRPLPIFKFPQTSSNQSHVVPWALNHRGNLNCHFFTCFVPEYARWRDNWPWTDWALPGAIPPSVSGVSSCPRWDPFTWGSLLFPSSVLTGDLDTQAIFVFFLPLPYSIFLYCPQLFFSF